MTAEQEQSQELPERWGAKCGFRCIRTPAEVPSTHKEDGLIKPPTCPRNRDRYITNQREGRLRFTIGRAEKDYSATRPTLWM